ncbi:PKD repeat protein [Lewinella marina]|uniref:PKD domain-containing protein n=1 Tax=Neolewinella marina TaxID=438751 RepID=UPI000C043E90|nr:PKD domain-containing protein [Neolewinella marina]NJB85853.1 PKD repeat protein [Neolewinella marina]
MAFCLLCSVGPAGAASYFEGPAVRSIPALTVTADTEWTYVVNGSFTGEGLGFAATLADGSRLPDWVKFSPAEATFTIQAPAAAVGELYQLRVTALDALGFQASVSFPLAVGTNLPDCRVDANTDRLGKILHCAGDTVTLRGYSASDAYRWTGPNGFSSSASEPRVTAPGLYVLASGTAACPNRAVVEVVQIEDCAADPDRNLIPTALIRADRLTGTGPLTVQFDATTSKDADGQVLNYRWSWEGGSATGPRPRVVFPKGVHEVILQVTDDTGARSTDRVYVTAFAPPTYATFWLEAECARVGENWATHTSSAASGEAYAASPRNATQAAPAAAPENLLTFTIRDAQEGPFRLFARVDAPSGFSDSYYLRVNGGAWYAWKSGLTRSAGFQWNEMLEAVNLVAGTNTIDIAFREAGTRIDKLFLSATGERPSGLGGIDYSCNAPNEPPVAVATVDQPYGATPLAVTLDGSNSADLDGRIVSYQWKWNGGSAEGVRPTALLTTGTYSVTLTVTDDGGLEDRDVVTIQVNEAPPALAGDFWLEAECAVVGSNWTTETALLASGQKYVVTPRGSAMTAAPEDRAENRVRFTLASAAAGTYQLFARINAPTNTADSYWVRVNNGGWYKWSSGIAQSSGFSWNKMPTGLTLAEGVNTIDFAFREAGAQLDKIYLTQRGSLPTGFGSDASNCEAANPAGASEAECALVNNGWQERSSADASEGTYMVFAGERQLDEPASDVVGQELQYEVVATKPGLHHLYIRLDAPDPGRNSVWVKVDNRPWMKFWRETNGDQLLTSGFEWRQVNHDGNAAAIDLGIGYHTIRIANREPGTKIDKVVLTSGVTAPAGLGPNVGGCGTTSESMDINQMSMSTTPASFTSPVAAPSVSAYPNPAVEQVTLSINSDYTGPVDLIVYDLHGRRIQEQVLEKESEQISTKLTIGSLPSGMYQVRVVEGDRSTTQSFIRR